MAARRREAATEDPSTAGLSPLPRVRCIGWLGRNPAIERFLPLLFRLEPWVNPESRKLVGDLIPRYLGVYENVARGSSVKTRLERPESDS